MRNARLCIPTLTIILYTVALTLFTAYVLLDTFVIEERYAVVSSRSNAEAAAIEPTEQSATASAQVSEQAAWTDTTYNSEGLSVTLTAHRVCNSTVYVAEVIMDDVSRLKTALAEDTYGRNVTELTSEIADENGAVLAINGDYYGAQRRGYVVRNGVLYRESVADADRQDLCIWSDGSMSVIEEGDATAQSLIDGAVWQLLSFGPALVTDGEIAVTEGQEVGKAKNSNPRTAIAMIEPLHYLFVVADGRTEDSDGVSLYELADFLRSLGASVAYNLDGGGSSTMVFGGEVVNYPTSWGGKYSEREVSDIVYVR